MKRHPLHWTQTPAGRKRMAESMKRRHAARKNGANGHINGHSLVAVEYRFENGENKLVYCRRKDDPKVTHV